MSPPNSSSRGATVTAPAEEDRHIFIPFTSLPSEDTSARNLPHWQHPHATYFITFRLGDSLPAHLLKQWQQELDLWSQHHPKPWNAKTQAEYEARFQDTREDWLDQGHGSCVLRDPALSEVITSALHHFHQDRYLLDSFVVMPNHVHLILKPLSGHSLSRILQSIKWFTSREINRTLNQSGPFWMDESYDHIVRDWNELNRFRQYIEQNPKKAKLPPASYRLELLKSLQQSPRDTGLQPVIPINPSSDTGLQPVRRAGILPAPPNSMTASDTTPAGNMPATPEPTQNPTGYKPVSQSSTPFPLCRIEDHGAWKKLPGDLVYNGRYVQIEECPFLTPARPDRPVPWTVAHRKSAIAVAPVTEDGRFILIHQERLPVMRSLWEFPAGQIDEPEETHAAILDTLHRELDEEAGCELLPGAQLTALGWFFGSQGFTSEHVYLFMATPVRQVREPQPVGDEHIGEVKLVTAAELRQMVAIGEIQDALTLALFARMSARGII